VPQPVLDVVPEDPQVEHVPDNVKKTSVKEHGGEDRHYVVGKKVVSDGHGSDELSGHEAVVRVEHCVCRGMEQEVLPNENNDIYKDQTRCYNG